MHKFINIIADVWALAFVVVVCYIIIKLAETIY